MALVFFNTGIPFSIIYVQTQNIMTNNDNLGFNIEHTAYVGTTYGIIYYEDFHLTVVLKIRVQFRIYCFQNYNLSKYS